LPHITTLVMTSDAPARPRAAWTWIGSAVLLALAARVAYFLVRYELGDPLAQRFRVESAALAWAVAGLVLCLTRTRTPNQRNDAGRHSIGLWALFCAGAVILYWPALGVGFLSDDFILVDHAASWSAGPAMPEFFRPVPLLLWGALLHLGGGAPALHLLNIVLHGTNAYLTTRVVAGWIERRSWFVIAGGLMLASPLAPEAVVWCSGVFDVFATTVLLAAVLAARRYASATRAPDRLAFIALAVFALLSKETAAVLPFLVAIDAWVRKTLPKTLAVDLAALTIAIAAISVARLTVRYGVASVPFRRFLVQRAVFTSFGGLAVPWHADALRLSTLLPLVSGVIALGLLTTFFLASRNGWTTRPALAGAAWILAGILPVLPILAIELDLEASRYLYLPSVGWAALLVAAAASVERWRLGHSAVVTSLILLIALDLVGVRLHLSHWIEAADLRNRVERAALMNPQMTQCTEVTLGHLPDSVRGAYLFRNGAREAFARDIGMKATAIDGTGPCAFVWDDVTGSFLPIFR
jgi:hypothetical protein